MTQSPILGRRAVYTYQPSTWDGKNYVSNGEPVVRRGVIVWIGTTGTSRFLSVGMLLDNGSLAEYDIHYVTVEAEKTEGPYR